VLKNSQWEKECCDSRAAEVQALHTPVDISWEFKAQWTFDHGRQGKRLWVNWRLLLIFGKPTGNSWTFF